MHKKKTKKQKPFFLPTKYGNEEVIKYSFNVPKSVSEEIESFVKDRCSRVHMAHVAKSIEVK